MIRKKINRSAIKFSFQPHVNHNPRNDEGHHRNDIIHKAFGIFLFGKGDTCNQIKQDAGYRDSKNDIITGPERICNACRIEVNRNRFRQAAIKGEKDYQRQGTQDRADNDVLLYSVHKYNLL